MHSAITHGAKSGGYTHLGVQGATKRVLRTERGCLGLFTLWQRHGGDERQGGSKSVYSAFSHSYHFVESGKKRFYFASILILGVIKQLRILGLIFYGPCIGILMF